MRLSFEDRAAIVAAFEYGETNGRQLASDYGVHHNTIYNIVRAAGAEKGRCANKAVALLVSTSRERARQALIQLHCDRIAASHAHTQVVSEFMTRLMEADQRGKLLELGL